MATVTHEKGYAILQAQMATKGSTEAEALCMATHGMTLADFHASDTDSDAKVAHYKECLKLPVFGLVKPAPAAPVKPAADGETRAALFGTLCAALRSVSADNHKRIAAHLRASTGKIALPIYDNDPSISDEAKAAFYTECLAAINSGDYSGFKSEPAKGDLRVEEPAKPAPAPAAKPARVAAPVAVAEPDDSDETDEAVANAVAAAKAATEAMHAALAARKQRPAAPSFDADACNRMLDARLASIEIPTKADIEGIISHAMNNGQFPTARVQAMIDTAAKSPMDALIRDSIDGMLASKLSDFIKRGAMPTTAPTKAKPVSTALASHVPEKDPTYVVSKEYRDLIRFVYDRSRVKPQNAFATGPRGCGKTSLGEVVAAEFGMPMLVMDCANIREQRDWFGYKYTEDGSVKWMRSQFDLCLAAGNHVIVIDEITRTTDQIRNVLNPLLDHRRRTFLQERGDFITVGPGTIIFVTANEGMAYTGCSALDLALADRLTARIEVNYLPEAQEAALLVKRTGIDKDAAKRLAEIAATVRGKAIGFGATLSNTITTRQLIEAAEYYKGLGVDGLTPTIINHFSADGGTESERSQVLQMISMKFPRES